jgi:hypothetical protein
MTTTATTATVHCPTYDPTATVQEFRTVDHQSFTLSYLGDGEWEAETPAGTFEVSSTSADQSITDDDSILVTGPNHHYSDQWFDTLGEVVRHLAVTGRDPTEEPFPLPATRFQHLTDVLPLLVRGEWADASDWGRQPSFAATSLPVGRASRMTSSR